MLAKYKPGLLAVSSKNSPTFPWGFSLTLRHIFHCKVSSEARRKNPGNIWFEGKVHLHQGWNVFHISQNKIPWLPLTLNKWSNLTLKWAHLPVCCTLIGRVLAPSFWFCLKDWLFFFFLFVFCLMFWYLGYNKSSWLCDLDLWPSNMTFDLDPMIFDHQFTCQAHCVKSSKISFFDFVTLTFDLELHTWDR